MYKFLVGLVDRLLIVVGAFVGSQFPALMQQYTQRLGGHVDELSHLLSMIKQSAALSNKSLTVYIQKFMVNSDPDFVLQGEFMKSIVSRFEQLNGSLSALTTSSLWSKPYIFFVNLDREIFASTVKSFHPAFNLTLEGVTYTALGMVLTYGLYRGCLKLLKMSAVFSPNTH